jgi:hypothetical protein
MQQIAIGFRSSVFEQYAQRCAENGGPSNRRFIERALNGSAPKCPPNRSVRLGR